MVKKKLLNLSAVVCAVSALFTGCSGAAAVKVVDLNSMTLDGLVAKAKEEGRVESVGMPDDWANWKDTWEGITATYGIEHADMDMSSAEELSLFKAEKDSPTKDIGDVGQSFGPVAVEMGVAQPYKPTTWDSIPDWAKDPEGNWAIAYLGTICFMTNANLVSDPPTRWEDIKNGEYKVSVGDVIKGTSSQCSVLSAAMAYGGDETNIQPGIDFFVELAKQGLLDPGDASQSRMEKGEIEVMVTWDYLALKNRDAILANNPDASFDIHIPSDGACQSGYSTIINAYAPHPHAAALAREYIFSDEGQINLAKGYAKPIRSDVVLPEDLAAKMIPDEQYASAKAITQFDAWTESVAEMSTKWAEDVIPAIK